MPLVLDTDATLPLAGFSQGAALALLLLAELSEQDPSLLPSFCILVRGRLAHCPSSLTQQQQACMLQVAGFVPHDPAWAARLAVVAAAKVPCMVVHGLEDQLVTAERSERLQRELGPALGAVHIHKGAHFIPSGSGQFKQDLLEFVGRHR